MFAMKILIAGDLSFYAESVCKRITSTHRLVLADEGLTPDKRYGNASIYRYSTQDQLFPRLFSSFDFNVVVFAMRWPGRQDAFRSGSLEDLQALLTICSRYHISRFILISSTAACGFSGAEETAPASPRNREGILFESGERMCMLFRDQSGCEALILRMPTLYGSDAYESLIDKWILQAAKRETILLQGRASQSCEFIHVEDAVSLLIRMIEDDADAAVRVVHACGGRPALFADVALWLQQQYPDCDFVFSADPGSAAPPVKGSNARRQYDWIALHDLQNDIREMCSARKKNRSPRRNWFGRLRTVLQRGGWLLQLIEIAAGFVLMQYLLSATADSLQFRNIDFRLLFVVLVGSIHGARAGVLAALLACVSSVMAYVSLNLDWRALVYYVDNWLPYISYLLVGAVTGYTRDRASNSIDYARQKLAVLETRFAFMNDLFQQVSQLKGQYKNQLISYRDSYGKVYEVINRLDSLVADEILKEAVHVLEEVFGNSAIAIYMLNPAGSYARLETCSATLDVTLKQSITTMQYQDIYENMMNGRIWTNRNMVEKYPFYCMPICVNDKLAAVVMAFNVPYELKSASGANQFVVLCRLIQSAYSRAVAFLSATGAQASIAGTHILLCDRFSELLGIQGEMKRKGLAGYELLQITDPGGDMAALCKKVERGVRRTDRIGQGADGNIYILLMQAQAESGKKIIDRLASLGIHCVSTETPIEGGIIVKESSDVA
jgi:nucleoside-diphosphate-sugar epimerase